MTSKKITCFSCGALVPDIAGPVHKYLASAPGCWNMYGEILAKEYAVENYDPILHRITVDAYAVQHPGVPSKQTINSANFHLIRLYSIYEKDLDPAHASTIMKNVSESKELHTQFKWLDPPSFDSTINVADVIQAKDLDEHKKIFMKWGQSVWNAWKEKHGNVIKELSEQIHL
jgi:hypothetical protein